MEVFWVFTTLVGGQHILNILYWIAEMMQKVTTKSLITMKVILEFWIPIDSWHSNSLNDINTDET